MLRLLCKNTMRGRLGTERRFQNGGNGLGRNKGDGLLYHLVWTAKPSTNKTGTLYIYADEDSFLYEVTDNGIKEVNGAKYDEDEGAWVVRTRKLSAYAIADQELDANKVIEEEKETSSSTESESNNSGKHNPDTGR